MKLADMERKRVFDEDVRKKAESDAEVARQLSAIAKAAAAQHESDDVEMLELSTPRPVTPGFLQACH